MVGPDLCNLISSIIKYVAGHQYISNLVEKKGDKAHLTQLKTVFNVFSSEFLQCTILINRMISMRK